MQSVWEISYVDHIDWAYKYVVNIFIYNVKGGNNITLGI